MNTKQLRYFIAIAGEGTFTKASAKLRVAQPALSRQIALLEDELGTPLLVRGSSRRPTLDSGVSFPPETPPYPPFAGVTTEGVSSSKEFHAWQFGQRPSGLAER